MSQIVSAGDTVWLDLDKSQDHSYDIGGMSVINSRTGEVIQEGGVFDVSELNGEKATVIELKGVQGAIVELEEIETDSGEKFPIALTLQEISSLEPTSF